MKILLFSTDDYFVSVFSDYIQRKKPNLELLCYTLESAAANYLANESADLMFCEEGYFDEYSQNMPYVALGTNTVMPGENGNGKLNIYQKAGRLLEDFERIIAIHTGKTDYADKTGKQIAVYSTEGGSGKTTIAYLLAVEYAKTKKTAYWNVEPLPVTENLYQQHFNHTMEQMLFAQKSGLQDLLYETLLQNEDGVYVLPGLQSFGDYRDMDAGQIKELCKKMYQMGIDRIILDLPGGMANFTESLLEDCEHIIWVFSDSKIGRKKEERVRQDPYLKSLFHKSSIVRNRCEKKESAYTVAAEFPSSATMQKANFISAVLEVNGDFVAGCEKIMEDIENKCAKREKIF